VGNITVGGTGKTPHVEYIAELLMRKGYRVAILSRGYKRLTRGFILADEHATASTIGDEPRQMQLRLPEAIIAVCEDRARGIRRLQTLYPDLDVIILDDAFQHRKVTCGYNVLLTASDNLYVNDLFLPAGRRRDTIHSSYRADMVVISKCPDSMLPIQRRILLTAIHPAPYQDVTFSYLKYSEPQALREAEHVYLLTGVAQPQHLVDHLGKKVVKHLCYPDHHRFTVSDLAHIADVCKEPYPIVTTEKDFVRLTDSSSLSEDLRQRLVPIRISVSFRDDEPVRDASSLFDARILRYVAENKRKKK